MAAKKAATTKKPAAAPKAKPATKAKPAAPKAKPATKKATAVKKPAVKLTDKQTDLLKKVGASGDAPYIVPGAEKRSIESLVEKKLVKPKTDKQTKAIHASLTAAGKKHIAPPKA